MEGVTTVSVVRVGDIATVQCSSSHLTSFAVLVDVGGAKVSKCYRGVCVKGPVQNQVLSFIRHHRLRTSLNNLQLHAMVVEPVYVICNSITSTHFGCQLKWPTAQILE